MNRMCACSARDILEEGRDPPVISSWLTRVFWVVEIAPSRHHRRGHSEVWVMFLGGGGVDQSLPVVVLFQALCLKSDEA